MAHSVSKSYESVGTRNENSFIFRNFFGKDKENTKKCASNLIQAVFKA